MLIYCLFLLTAIIVGCLPPLKSLFKSRGSFQRYKSSNYDKNLPPGIRLDAIRLGSAENSENAKAEPKATSRQIDGKENVLDGGYRGGYDVPHGAIGVRTDYVSCDLDLEGRVDGAD